MKLMGPLTEEIQSMTKEENVIISSLIIFYISFLVIFFNFFESNFSNSKISEPENTHVYFLFSFPWLLLLSLVTPHQHLKNFHNPFLGNPLLPTGPPYNFDSSSNERYPRKLNPLDFWLYTSTL